MRDGLAWSGLLHVLGEQDPVGQFGVRRVGGAPGQDYLRDRECGIFRARLDEPVAGVRAENAGAIFLRIDTWR